MNISKRLRACAKHTGLDAVIELLQEAADEIDALQARAQVQGEPVTVAVDHFDNGPFEAYTNRIYPHVEIGTKLYTTPQPAQVAPAEVTDAQILSLDCVSIDSDAHGTSFWVDRSTVVNFARAILALRPVQSGLTGCNCRWDGDTQVQWCELHLAHKEAIHEWAERAKEAEKQLALRPSTAPNLACSSVQARLAAQWGYVRPVAVPMTEDQVWHNDALMSANGTAGFKMDALMRIVRATEAHHGITAQDKKETP